MIVLQTLRETMSILQKKLLTVLKTVASFEKLHCLLSGYFRIIILMNKFCPLLKTRLMTYNSILCNKIVFEYGATRFLKPV